jgi:hypothetical protein
MSCECTLFLALAVRISHALCLELVGHEIVDETDSFLDGTHAVKLNRGDAFNLARLRLLDSKIVDETLTLEETQAVTAHLLKNFPSVVALISENQLHRLIAETPVSVLPTVPQEFGVSLPSDLLYEKGVATDVCTLILSGKVTVLVGADQFRSELSSWSLIGTGALDNPEYKPDFSAFVSSGPCRCIRISRARFSTAVDASAFERTQQQHTSSNGLVGTFPPSGPVTLDITTVESEQIAGIEKGEASRKSKLMTALRAVDRDSTHQNQILNESTSGGIMFAEPGTLARAGSIRATSLLSAASARSVESSTATDPPEATSRFEFIGSPASRASPENKK